MRSVFMTIAVVLLLATIGCNQPAAPAPVLEQLQSRVLSYGNGVYYFPFIKAEFGVVLSAFRLAHPDLEQESMTGDGTGGYGYDQGYFVTFRQKNQ